MNKYLIFLVVVSTIFLFGLSTSYAAQPIQVSTLNALQIDYPKYDFIKLGYDHRFHVHVINATSLKTNKTTSCILHFYNQSGWDIQTVSTAMEFEDYNGVDFALTIDKNNYTSVGSYSWVVQCNSTNEVGFASGQIEVNYTGREDLSGASLLFFILGFLVVIAGFTYTLINTVGRILQSSMDITDLAFDWVCYFVLLGFNFFEIFYFNVPLVNNMMNVFIYVGAFTHGIVPAVFFFMFLLKNGIEQARRASGMEAE